ncbi:MAG: LacI family DNA-binding transcriptional regulator [Clostridiaceae bacterium]|nr:LacI family DNA-binding transcriptional regulator [Clostridiaceae bacterium]
MRSTRADVAKLAGVSTSTVSYVLNNSKSISPETADKVLQAVKTLNYRPNIIARSLSTHMSMHLGVFVEDIANPFYGDIIHGFESSAYDKGYFVSVCTSLKRYDEYLENAISRRLDGIFIAVMPSNYSDAGLETLLGNGIHIVTSGYSNIGLKKVSSIENDYITAMRDAMLHLYGRGHRDIAFITGLTRTQTFDQRVAGYLAMVDQLKLGIGDDLLIEGKPPYRTTLQDGYDLAQKLIKSGRQFTALICVNDLVALGAYAALNEAHLRIPEDVAVIGFDDIIFSQFSRPSLTTLSIDKIAFGKKAFELLYTNITLGNTGFYLNPLTLQERQSTNFRR